jgi:hypothetical protein
MLCVQVGGYVLSPQAVVQRRILRILAGLVPQSDVSRAACAGWRLCAEPGGRGGAPSPA